MTLEVGISDSAAVPLLHDARRDLEYAKPRLRGWMHLASFEAALVLGTVLIISADGAWNTTVASVYAAAVAGMFGASALYHRGSWSAATSAWLQRLDHLMIFVVIAGTATPPMALCLPGAWSWGALTAMWSLTVLAAAIRLTRRMQVREWVAGAVFVGLGWGAGAAVPAVWLRAGVAPAILLVAGGLLYTVGALAYHARTPDPRPEWFGYHEVFHSFVSAAAACQYVAIACFLF